MRSSKTRQEGWQRTQKIAAVKRIMLPLLE
jgi:hypothetical protein